jgi:haloacetate dehalogenase
MALFEGFRRETIDTGEAQIACVHGGNGPPVLLLHGYPQTLAEWGHVAPVLKERMTVVCGDLRGYGDSSKPKCLPDRSNYTFRAMAADQVRLMARLGHQKFHVVGHDRGARVAHRMALDFPERVLSLSVLDIVPTYAMYKEVNQRLAQTYWQWYFLPLPEPYPETLIGANPDFYFESCMVSVGGAGLDRFDQEMLAEYRRCWRDPAMIHGSCSDYRAGATLDLQHDEADLHRKLECPVLALWGADGLMQTLWDIPAKWRERCTNLTTGAAPGGHWFPDLAPKETARALLDFIKP